MIRCIFILMVVVSLGAVQLRAEPTKADSIKTQEAIKLNGQYFKRYWTDTRDVFTAPFRWNNKQWMTAGAVLGTTGLLFLVDEDIQATNGDIHTNGGDHFSKYFLEPCGSGDPWKNYSFYLMGAMGSYGLIAKDNRSWNTALLSFEAYVLTFAYVQGLKRIGGRERPVRSGAVGAWEWNGPGHGQSFPSGHTTSVFAMAAVIAEQYKDVKWVPWASYSFASLVGVSRIYDNKHWASDVFMGACLGTAIGQLIARSQKSELLTLMPVVAPQYAGLSMRWRLN